MSEVRLPRHPSGVAQALLIPLMRRAGPTRTVLLHPLGGGLGTYAGLIAYLSQWGSVHGMRAFGLKPGEEPDTSIAGMVGRYTDILRGLPEQPNLLAGWSLGGLLAWEIAARLAETGPPPAVLMIDSSPERWHIAEHERAALHQRIVGEATDQLDDDQRQALTATLDAHIKARLDYEVIGTYRGSALLISCSGASATHESSAWRQRAPNLTVRALDCGHFDVFFTRNLPALAGFIDEFLRGVAASGRTPPSPSLPLPSASPRRPQNP